MQSNREIKMPKSEEHILFKLWNSDYGVEFRNAFLDYFKGNDGLKKRNKLYNKLFFNQTNLSTQQINQFVQGAVELSVVRYLKNEFPENFSLEPKIKKDSGNDIECQFKFKGMTYNVEVKATSYYKPENKKDKEKFSIKFIGHFDNYKEIASPIMDTLGNTRFEKRYDGNLISHLESAQSKFSDNIDSNTCNVLILGCNNSDDLQDQFTYLKYTNGLFTNNPLKPHSHFDLVDIVFLTNLYFKHNQFEKLTKLDSQSWKFEKNFILSFRNPYRRNRAYKQLDLIESIIPNYNSGFKEFYDIEPNVLRLKQFIHGELGENRGIYHF